MRFFNKSIKFIPSKFYLLFLYIPFFIVQGFFNVEIYSNNNPGSIGSVISAHSKNHQSNIFFNTNKSSGNKAGIRLNKRFQPEKASILISPSFQIAVYFIRSGLFYSYPDPAVYNPHFLSNKLRGPPVFA